MHHLHVHVEGGHRVRAGDGGAGVVGAVDALRRVSPLVVQHAAAYAQHLTPSAAGDLDLPKLVTLLDGRQKVLHPVFHPFDGLLAVEGGRGHGNFFGVDHELGAKTTAHIGRGDAHHGVLQAQGPGHRELQFMRHLGGGPDHQGAVLRLVMRQQTAPFHGVGPAAVLAELFAKHMRRIAEHRLAVAVADLKFLEHIAGGFQPDLG